MRNATSRPLSWRERLLAAHPVGLGILLVLIFTIQPNHQVMRIGEVASDTVVAQRKVNFVDRVATAANRKQAVSAVAPVYRSDPSTARKRQAAATTFLRQAAPIISANGPTASKLSALQKLLPSGVPRDRFQQLPELTPSDFVGVEQRSLGLLAQAVGWRFNASQLMPTEIGLVGTLSPQVSARQRSSIGEIITTFLAPTLVRDTAATLRKQHAAAARVSPVTDTLYQGEVIVRRGDIVTPTVMGKLAALGVPSRNVGPQEIMASLLFAALILTLMFWYLHLFHAGIATSHRLLLLIDGSILLTVLGARLFTAGHVLLPYFLPVAAASTFAAVLVMPEAAVALALATALLAGWIVSNSFELTVYYFASSLAGVLAMRRVRRIKQFILAAAAITTFGLVASVAFGLVDRSYDLSAFQEHFLAAGFNGVVSAILALGGFALLSDFFGVTTSLRLLELAQPDQPLLRRLMTKAPGTYNHSVVVASMVERAAEDVGADSLVSKLAALYHDVGKTTNPQCFIENQLGGGNVHDELRAEESARIIRSHVSHGLRLGHQNGLPRAILDAIAEHHGTMTIAYFLHRAETENEPTIDPSVFSYPGPKPQTRETALLMLADGCEAAVRAGDDHSTEGIGESVDRIIQDRIGQGQLDESPLTLRDLELSRNAFVSVLGALYHPRIDYPEPIDLSAEAMVRSGTNATR